MLTAGCLLILGCGEATVTRVVDVEACSGLRAQGDFDIALRAMNNGVHIAIQGTRQTVDAADLKVADGVVSIMSSTSSDIRVQVSCPDLRVLELIGAVRAEQIIGEHPARYEKVGVYGQSQFAAQQLSAINIDIRGSGSAQIAIDKLVAEHTQLLLSGESQTVVAGETSELIVEVTGGAALAAQSLQAQTVKVKAAGDSRSAIRATAHLSAILRDAAYVSYAGTPDLVVDASEQTTLDQVTR